MSRKDDNEKPLLRKTIVELLEKGKTKLQSSLFKNEDNIIKIKLLKLMFQSTEEEDLLYYNIKNMEIDISVVGMIKTFLSHLQKYTVELCIMEKDSISKFYYSIKDKEVFISFSEKMQKNQIPFFQALRFISYLNNDADITNDIVKFVKKNKYVRTIIHNYIEKVQGSLWKIIFMYNNYVLKIYDENEIQQKDDHFFQLYDAYNLIELFQKYICYNDCYSQGEIADFISILFKSLTCNMKKLYLNEGNEVVLINDLIKLIFETIAEKFQSKNYYERKQVNELYNLLADFIKDRSELSCEDNYAKFVVQYSRYYLQGNNKLLVKLFMEGLNRDNFPSCFKEIPFEDNENFYANIEKYIDYIKCAKKKRKIYGSKGINENKIEEISTTSTNNSKTSVKDEEKLSENDIQNNNISKEDSYNNKKDKKNNNTSFSKDNKFSIHINEIKNEKKIQDNNNNDMNCRPSNENENILIQKSEMDNLKNDLLLEINELKKIINENKTISDKNRIELEELKEKYKKSQESYKKSQESYSKLMNIVQKNKKDLDELKKEMKRISYRDISKLIINKYISKYENKLPLNANKKKKAELILSYIVEKDEKNYFKKISETYFDSNIKSHISYILKESEKKMIIGSNYNTNSLINEIFKDYCEKIIEEKNENKINVYIDIKAIIRQLYENYLNSFYKY